MNTIESHTIHLWLAKLPEFESHVDMLLTLLSPDEVKRAERFHFPLHRKRYIITRGLLRKILNLYTKIASDQIVFTYGPHGKPYLADNTFNLQFNISHSADMAVFAFTTLQEIGVDIEKIEPGFKEEVAKRFFSKEEYVQLMALSGHEQIKRFYQIWCRKEAVIKTLGQGLFIAPESFSTNLPHNKETISLTHSQQTYQYYIENLTAPEGYQAAFATLEPIEKVIYQDISAA